MRRSTRRTFLATVTGAALSGGLAGCLASDGETTHGTGSDGATSTDSWASTSRSSTTTRPTTEPSTPAEARIRLTAVDELPTDAAVVVYPPTLREWLRRAAERSGPVRGSDDAFVYAPDPVLEDVDRIRLVGSTAVEGTYDLSVDGGPRYDLLVGAEPVDEPPANASIVPSETLSSARRDLVERAVDEGQRATVSPETELGEWTRTAFFDGYVSHDGSLYRGYEVQQTDAAFFSTEVWYVLSLSPVGSSETPRGEAETTETIAATASSATASASLTLRLASVPNGFADRVDPLLADRTKDQPEILSDPADLPADVERFTRETTYLLTHTELFAVELAR
ncbi:hypothetical protein [Salinigranum sp. GCM10025319]|uniref:hypothetical protein n=1 Tax=Salinigranum sp. GCM10025319 TaxID=3252687 RepID=UPI00361B2F5A